MLMKIAGVRERHLESIVRNTLQHIVLVTAHARTLVQVTLQITSVPRSSHEEAIIYQSSPVIYSCSIHTVR